MTRKSISLPSEVLADLDEIGQSHTVEGMLTWAKCRDIGERFARYPVELHSTMIAYLAQTYRLGRKQIGNHLKVFAITSDLPEPVLEMVPWSVAHLIRKRHGDDTDAARAELLDLVDGDRSLVQQRLAAIKAAAKGERKRRLSAAIVAAVPKELRRLTDADELASEDKQRIMGLVWETVRVWGEK